MALHIGIGNFGGAMFSNVYRTQDAPRYRVGRESIALIISSCLRKPGVLFNLDGIALMFASIGIIATSAIALSYRRINAKREKLVHHGDEQGVKRTYSHEEIRDLGDKAPDFRYTL